MKSPIYTILLSKSDFSFALLLVTFELLEVEQSYIPLLKALVSGINAVGAQGCGCMFRLCHTSLKMGLLLHKTEIVCRVMLLSVNISLLANCLIKCSTLLSYYRNYLIRSRPLIQVDL